MNLLFEEFKTICFHLNRVGITPTLMGSLGLEFRRKKIGGRLTLTFMCLVTLEVGKHLIISEFMIGTR